ncbi:uncharacterized protein LOC118433992 [Folsomia candida]|uniref:uncharacterized protein LOC118433992 n=1 Tax=Folsomia candida TaxID=158441 RepID=UPI0016052617|nr:uncharacterized protein LOC118433992 [Folsomia candida]
MFFFKVLTSLSAFSWDEQKRHLRQNKSKSGMVSFYLHFVVILVMNVYCAGRLIQSLSKNGSEFPLLIKILNLIWTGAYTFTSILMMQYQILGKDMMLFANSILDQLDWKQHEISARFSSARTSGTSSSAQQPNSGLSKQLITAMILLTINPLIHALIVPTAPCAPQFLSSVLLPCKSIGDSDHPLYTQMPFIIQEYYGITVKLFTWSFNWSLTFLGLTWILREIKTTRMQGLHRYRNVEIITTALNSSLKYYLTIFPTILFTVLSLLLFGCVRLWHLDPRSNLLFPTCGIRCGFESMSPLALAGRVNQESKSLLRKWRKQTSGGKWAARFKRSCRSIKCTAGSMYTFEESILIVSIHNLNQLTLNFLVAFR